MSYHLEKRARMEGGSANEVQRKASLINVVSYLFM
jgi:hypothetical protein